jgi:predicted LPLAT superfamily acyltransferase
MSAERPRWAEKAERGSGLALRFLIFVVRSLGPRASRLVLHPIAAYFLITDREARGASRAYFERLAALPEGRAALGHAPGWRDTYRHLFEFSTSLFDRMCVWAGQDDDFALEHRAEGHFAHLPDASGERANPLGKCGAMIASAHVGAFDMMRAICMDAAVPVHVVMYGDNAETINRFFAGLNPDLDLDLIHIRPGSVSATFEIRSAVDRGNFVVIMGDRVPIAGVGVHSTRFLGAPARFPTGPFELAALIGCPMMVATAVRVGPASYQVDSEPLYPGGRVPRAEREKVVQEMVERYAAYLERTCLRAPYQWFNFFDFWA